MPRLIQAESNIEWRTVPKTVCALSLLSLTQAYLWLLTFCWSQNAIFEGRAGGEDYGLGTIVPALLLTVLAAIMISGFTSRFALGKPSYLSITISGFLVIPLAEFLEVLFEPSQPALDRLFWLLGGMGHLPEGRPKVGLPVFNAWLFIIIALTTLGALLVTHRSRMLRPKASRRQRD